VQIGLDDLGVSEADFAPGQSSFAAADFSKALLTDAEFGQTELEGGQLCGGEPGRSIFLMIVQ